MSANLSYRCARSRYILHLLSPRDFHRYLLSNPFKRHGSLTGSDFEAVDESSLQVSTNSGQAGSSPVATPTKAPTPTPTKNAVISLVPLPTFIKPRICCPEHWIGCSGSNLPSLSDIPFCGMLYLAGTGILFLLHWPLCKIGDCQ